VIRYAGEIGLDTERFTRDLRDHAGQAKIAADVDSADLSGVSGTRRSSSTANATAVPTTSVQFPARSRRPGRVP
jgi:hypothetical protein